MEKFKKILSKALDEVGFMLRAVTTRELAAFLIGFVAGSILF